MKNLAWIASCSLLFVTGCSSTKSESGSASSEKSMMAKESGTGYYAEVPHKGRIYVLGTEKAQKALTQSQQTPSIAKTYIGSGADGQTLVLEADAKTNELQERLKAQYESRHGVKLP